MGTRVALYLVAPDGSRKFLARFPRDRVDIGIGSEDGFKTPGTHSLNDFMSCAREDVPQGWYRNSPDYENGTLELVDDD